MVATHPLNSRDLGGWVGCTGDHQNIVLATNLHLLFSVGKMITLKENQSQMFYARIKYNTLNLPSYFKALEEHLEGSWQSLGNSIKAF